LRDTEVQQPNTAATFSFDNKSRAFSAKSGQFEAGSSTTASTFLPSSPPFLLMSSTIIRMVSLRVDSLIAIVPDSECKTPILIVSRVWAPAGLAAPAMTAAAIAACHILFNTRSLPLLMCVDTTRRPVRVFGRSRPSPATYRHGLGLGGS
jgi:hypothetical protein